MFTVRLSLRPSIHNPKRRVWNLWMKWEEEKFVNTFLRDLAKPQPRDNLMNL